MEWNRYFKKARNIVEFSVQSLKIKSIKEFCNQLHFGSFGLFLNQNNLIATLFIIVFQNYCFDKL